MISRSNVNLLSAVLGGGAVIAMGVLGVEAAAGTGLVAEGANMNLGSTSIATTPSTVPAVTMAVPGIKGPSPLPAEEQAPPAP